MKAVVFKDKGKIWRWHIAARNGKLVATSGEGFDSKGNASRALKSFIRNLVRVASMGEVTYSIPK